MSRVSSVQKGAQKRGHLEEGETVQEVAVVGKGSVHLPDLGRVSLSRAVIAATERNLYVLKLGQIGFSSIKDLVLKRPIESVYVDSGSSLIDVGTKDEGRLATYKVIPMQSPKRLIEYVKSRSE